jgi:polyhydroxyalkanoate synthase
MPAPDDRTLTAFAELVEAQQRLVAELLSRPETTASRLPAAEFPKALLAAACADPGRIQALQSEHCREQFALWMHHFGHGSTNPAPPETTPDRRFSAREWSELPWFSWLRDSYLSTSRWLESVVASADVDDAMRRRLLFFTRQFTDAMAPTNHAATNPEALRLALESHGESLRRGLANLRSDLEKGRISMTDETAFEVGRNLATTPGSVVYQNELMQVLQYRAATPTVHAVPLVIVPPCINKYYVLDLQPHNSFVRYAVGNGLTVFVISWRNMSAELGRTTWDAYLQDGVARALEVARAITGAAKVHALGFCVGGTLLASTLAMLRRKRRRPAATLTLLATLLDFADSGDVGVYIDETYVRHVEEKYREGGVLPGGQLAATFASLRANELVWHYVINNYLKGRRPDAFDLLHWNSDSANLAGTMVAYYLRHMYLENALREPDRLSMCGVPVDLGRIGLPTYVLATHDDHIVPWNSAYAGAQLLGPEVEFVLGASGHIAGVVNPASTDRRSYRTGPPPSRAADAWLTASQEHPGSWWKHWAAWIGSHSGARIAAPAQPGSAGFPPLADAPGSYVHERV